jgi:predicted RND superfamily exporter protein
VKVLADFILSYPRTIFVFIILLSFAALFPASRIDTDFNLEGFFPENSPTIEEYRMLSEEFGKDDNLIGVAFQVEDVFDPIVLQNLKKITDQLELIENVTEVFSLWTANRFVNDNGNLISEPYLSDNITSYSDLNDVKSEILDDAFIRNVLVNQPFTVTAFYIELDDDTNSYFIRDKVISDLLAILDSYPYNFRIAGIPYFRNQYVNMLNSEIILYISISSLFIILLLWFIFRDVRGVLIPMSIVWLTILFTVAIIVLTGGYFEILSSSIAPILLCVGVADSIHLLAKYQDSRLNGMSPGSSLRETIIILGSATFLTSITTAIGFGTLVTSSVIPMQRFGIYTAAGVLVAFVITIFLLPTILPYFKEPTKPSDAQARIHVWLGVMLKKTNIWVYHHHKIIVISTLIIVSFFAFGATLLKVNGKIFDDVGESTQVMKDSEFFTENLVPQFPLEFVIDTGLQDGAFSPEVLSEIERFESFLTRYDEIERTISLTTLIARIHATMSPEEAAVDRLPNDRELIAQYMFLLEITDPDAATRLVDFNYQKIRLASNVQDVGSWRMNQIRNEIQVWLSDAFPNEVVYISGTSILVADLTENIVSSLSSSILLAFLFISLIMGLLFKDIRLVIISILPNIIPLIVTAGVMGYFGVDIKPSTAVIFTIAFGIAVDDSIHYLARLRIELTRCESLYEAIAITTEKTGRAIVLTSAILVVGFGTLGTSAFTSTMLMGSLTCLTIFIALIADILFLPALLYWVKPTFKRLLA